MEVSKYCKIKCELCAWTTTIDKKPRIIQDSICRSLWVKLAGLEISSVEGVREILPTSSEKVHGYWIEPHRCPFMLPSTCVLDTIKNCSGGYDLKGLVTTRNKCQKMGRLKDNYYYYFVLQKPLRAICITMSLGLHILNKWRFQHLLRFSNDFV